MKRYMFSFIYGVVLLLFSAYILLDIYVLPDKGTQAVLPQEIPGDFSGGDYIGDHSVYIPEDKEALDTNVYEDSNIKITLTTYREYDTTVYVADVRISDPLFLKTAFAKDKYGTNIKEKTTEIAERKNAILAVNGDFYSARKGCVIRNSTLYRDFGSSDNEVMVIYSDGSVGFVQGADGYGEQLLNSGACQVLSFGPVLIKDGNINVDEDDEVDKAMRDNPRTAFVYYSPMHYAFVVGEGRTDESKGLSLYRLASFLKDLGAESAYNLDGGGSSTMYFNGELINKPTTNGKKISEREVSDIVYIGY